MKTYSNGILLIAVLIISVLQTPAMPAGEEGGAGELPGESSQSKPDGQKSRQSCYRSFEQLLDEQSGHGSKIDFLIATVPDPIDSQMGWHFDLQIGAIQRAIEGSGYVVDRYSLPWSCVPMQGDKARSSPSHRIHEVSPGVIFFRSKEKEAPRLLALFLVGETPTAGIHKSAFKSAMDSIERQWVKEGQSPGEAVRRVRLLGPTFSGSAKSLKGIIDDCWKKNAEENRAIEFMIVSGSASNPDNKEVMERPVDGTHFVKFQATVLPDDVVIDALVNYFTEIGVDHHKVAVLRESNTVYGGGLPQAESSEAHHEGGECGPRCWLTIPFPMHIAKTRSAYEKSLPLKEQSSELTGEAGATERAVLPLTLDESGNPRDVLPALASTTPFYDELVLSSILSTISRAGFRYVGLLATDTKDKLFLARQVRKYCPDVRLFTLESDILYSHPTYSFFMEGIIVASTYPLFNKNQLWSSTSIGQQKRLQFPNNGAQGVYNAALALLDKRGEMLEYATPFKKYEAGSETRPSVWLSTVGREGLWPLRFYSNYNGDYVIKGIAPARDQAIERQERRIHLGFTPSVLLLLSIFSLICCFGYLRVYRWPEDQPLPSSLGALEIFRPRLSLRRQRAQNRYLIVFFLALGLLYIWLGTLFLIPRAADIRSGSQTQVWERLYIAGILYCAFLLAVTTLVAFVRVISSEKRFARLLLLKGMRARRMMKRLAFRRALRKAGPVGDSMPVGLFGAQPPNKKPARLKNPLVRITATAAGLMALYALTFLYAVPNLFSMVEAVLLVYRQPGQTLSRAVQSVAPGVGSNGAVEAGLIKIATRAEGSRPASEADAEEPLVIDTAMLMSERARHASNGVSPVFPVLSLATGLCMWSLFGLRRLRLAESVTTASPFASGGLASAGVTRLETQVRQTLEDSFKSLPRGPLLLALFLLSGTPVFVISMRFLSTFEGPVFDYVFLGAFFLLHITIALTFLQFLSLWHRLRQLLRRLALHPTVGAYDRLPSRLSRQVGEQFLAASARVADQVFSVQQWLLLCSHFNARIEDQAKTQLRVPEETIKRLEFLMQGEQTRTLREGFAEELGEHSLENISRGKTRRTLSNAAGALMEMLEYYWKSRGLCDAKPDADAVKSESLPANKPTTDLFKRDVLDPLDVWFRLAEDFIASQVVTFINQVFVHLRTLLTYITAGSLLMLLTITYYPFQPQRLMTLFVWGCILSIILASTIVFIQASRNEVLSRIAGTAANRVTLDRTFISMIVTYGILPLLGLLITQFPQMLRILSWIEPAIRAFK